MRYTKRIKNLGLSEKDFRILSTLNELGRSKILPLSKQLDLQRTSVSFRLRKMGERGLVKREQIGGHFEWTLNDYAKNIILEEKGDNNFKVTNYYSLKNIDSIIVKILKNKSNERIYFIEPYHQMEKFVSSIEQNTISAIAELFKKRKNISVGVSSVKNIKLLENYDKKTLENMLGRMTIVYTIPDEYLNFKDMIIVYKDFIYIFNFNEKSVVEIESSSFAKSMKSIILALQNFGKKIDLNEQIREVLKSKK